EADLRMQAFDFEGAYQICDAICKAAGPAHHYNQPQTIGRIAAGYMAVERGQYNHALELFKQVDSSEKGPKFFLHWVWCMIARLESGNVLLLMGDVSKARIVANAFLETAILTSDPHLQALAWELKARIELAENKLADATESIKQSLAIVERSESPVAA